MAMTDLMDRVGAYADGLCEFSEELGCDIDALFEEGFIELTAKMADPADMVLVHFMVGWMTAAAAAMDMDAGDLVVAHADSEFGIEEVAVA